jgi:hypothetical protein
MRTLRAGMLSPVAHIPPAEGGAENLEVGATPQDENGRSEPMVDWVDGAIDDPRPASDAAVRQAQDELEVKLPSEFLAVAQIHQGAAPVPAAIDLPNGFSTAVDHLLHFEDSPFVSNIVAAIFPLLDVLDEGIIPFAADAGGDFWRRPSPASWTCCTTRDGAAEPGSSCWRALAAAEQCAVRRVPH